MSESSFENVLSSIMGNEALMGKISSIMSSHNGDRDESLPEVIEAISSSLGENKGEDKNDEKKEEDDTKGSKIADSVLKKSTGRNSLLIALRPYLSDKRAKMIDQLLRLEQVAEIIKLTR